MTGIDEALQPILPRELTSISDDVRAVAPQPTPSLAEPYGIRLADPDFDAGQVSEWMNRPHLAAAWEYDWPPSRWRRYLRAQLDGAYSRPFIGSLRGRDLGYVELYRAAKDSIATRYAADPYDVATRRHRRREDRQPRVRPNTAAAHRSQCFRV
jgi:lysine N-acyltransferase